MPFYLRCFVTTDNLYCGKQVVIMMTAFLVNHGENKKGRKYTERFNYNEVAWKRNQKVLANHLKQSSTKDANVFYLTRSYNFWF